jgi:hypothetical protein
LETWRADDQTAKLRSWPAVLSKTMRWVVVGFTIALFLGVFGWRRLHEPKCAGQPMRYWLQKVFNGNQSEETNGPN